jgi:hypothetical protein
MKKTFIFVWRSPILLFCLTLLAVIACGLLAIKSPLFANASSGFFKILLFCLALLPILFTMFGLLDCAGSEVESTRKFAWLAIMVVAPVLGPLFWFAVGRPSAKQPFTEAQADGRG